MSTAVVALTVFHVAISLVGLSAGFVVLWGFVSGRRLDRWTAVFLSTTALTSATGFLFPVEKLLPSHVLGVISLVGLAVTAEARYRRQLSGAWRHVFVIGSVFSQYLNFFVLVVQSFLKVPALHALAPTQSELPFAVTQLAVLAVFVGAGWLATARFPASARKPG